MGHETPISKTQRKKDMAALQELGAELVALSGERLAAIGLPEILHDAVLAARRITSFEARRRQLQYIGKLMRNVDPEPIRARLDAWKAPSRIHTAQFKRTESWRKRLLAGEEGALAEFLGEYPLADERQLDRLIRDARQERDTNHPPKSYRALFEALRTLIERSDS